MPSPIDLIALFLMGLLGSAHCMGMCGGFSILAGKSGRWTAYALGKTATYVVLGMILGIAGSGVTRALPAQQVLSIVVGVALILVGVGLTGLLPERWTSGNRITGWIGPRLASAMSSGRFRGVFAMGMLNGLLPCGLVYAALLKSLEAGGPTEAGFLMAVFGLATLPGLWLMGLFGSRLPPSSRVWIVRLGGLFVVALGCLTIWRAAMVPAHLH